jgi:RimJ/RimL family protein N-acetyltransferase
MIKIEAARPEDVYGLVRLMQVCAPHGLLRKPDEINNDFIKNKLPVAGRKWFFVAWSEAAPIGIVWGQVYDQYRLRQCVGELSLAVHPLAQSNGIGRTLMTHLIESIKQNSPQIRRIELMCNPHNTKAVALYKSLGFEKEGLLKARVISDDGQPMDDLQMGLILTSNKPSGATNKGSEE